MRDDDERDGARRDPSDAAGEADDEEGEEELERGKPLSVRDVMPSSPARARPRKPEGTEEDEASAEEGAEDRPTPVRVAMDTPPPGDSRPPQDLPSRRFQVEGQEWIARITGRSVTGTRPDSGAPLMHLTFYRSDTPETPEREVLTVERDLEVLFDEDLAEFLERSRPSAPE